MEYTLERDQKENIPGIKGRVHPRMFALYLGMASMGMLFAALTSALIVRRADAATWLSFDIPDMFIYSTFIIVLSSIVLQSGFNAYKNEKAKRLKNMLGITLILGIVFLVLQYFGWQAMEQNGILLDGNPSGSFLYVLSGVHGVHIIGGLVFLFLAWFRLRRDLKDPINELKEIINPSRRLNLRLLLTYWHFIGIVWVYLFIFFKITY